MKPMNVSSLKTVNSLSGGRTSSYLAANYPADLEIFSIVCVDSHNTGKSIDKKLMQMANDKLQKYSSHYPEFRGTTENPIILKTMFDLEQHIGKEIIWLRGMSWEDMLKVKKAIPNMAKRFCTSIMKMQPIFEFLYMYHSLPVKMRVGYRYDELERADKFTDKFKFSQRCEYRPKSNTWVNRWDELVWRVGDFPLIDNKVIHPMIIDYWKDKNVVFAEDSNCLNCFWKSPQQLRKNFDDVPEIMYWAAIMEGMYNYTFRSDLSLLEISKIGIQQGFEFGGGSGCSAGFCTD